MESKSTPSTKPATKKTSAIKRLHIYYRWLRLNPSKGNVFAYPHRQWRLLSLTSLYIFFRPAFEDKLSILLVDFKPDNWSFAIWCGFIPIAIVYTCILAHRRYIISEGRLSWTVVILAVWAYYRFIDTHYIATPTPISGICYVDLLPILGSCVVLGAGWSYWMRTKHQQKGVHDPRRGFEAEIPCSPEDKDLLGRRKEAQNLAEGIFQTDTSNGAFTLGITSPWGAGKTSFMLAIKKHLKLIHSREIILLDFNPWMYRKAPNLTQIFFEELSRALAPYSSALASGFMQYVDYILSKENNTWIQLGARLLPQGFKAKSTNEQYKFLEKEIGKLRRKIVIFIDDVDRLDSEELIELFSLVRNISPFPNMSYILTYDKKYVLLQLEKKGLNEELAVSYMEKIIQVEFPLAEITSEQIEKAFSDVLEQSAEEYPNLKEAIRSSNIELRSHLPTLRSIKQTQNILSSFPKKLKGNVIPFDWFIIELIRTQYPLFFSFLKENYTLIFDDWGDGKLFIKTQEDETGRIDLPAKIKEHIPSNKSEQVLELMTHLWGEDRENGHGQANNWEYIGIYFYRVLDKNDIRIAELNQYLANQASELPQSLENLKSYVNQMLNSYRWLTFCNLVCARYSNSLNEAVNMLCLAFYMLSREERRWLQNVSEQIDKCIDSIREYEGEEAQKKRLKELFDYSDIRKGVLLYISSILNRTEKVRIPFSSDELEAIKEKLFLKYTQDNTSIDPIDCYRLWLNSQTKFLINIGAIRSGKPMIRHTRMDKKMGRIIRENAQVLIPYFIQQHPHYKNKYKLLSPDLIQKLHQDLFTRDLNPNRTYSSEVLEFKQFLQQWMEYIGKLKDYLRSNEFRGFLAKPLEDNWENAYKLRETNPEVIYNDELLLQAVEACELAFIEFQFKAIKPQNIYEDKSKREPRIKL